MGASHLMGSMAERPRRRQRRSHFDLAQELSPIAIPVRFRFKARSGRECAHRRARFAR
jgi:hypothetical protein